MCQARHQMNDDNLQCVKKKHPLTVCFISAILFKLTHHSWRYERNSEWVFFFWTQCIKLSAHWTADMNEVKSFFRNTPLSLWLTQSVALDSSLTWQRWGLALLASCPTTNLLSPSSASLWIYPQQSTNIKPTDINQIITPNSKGTRYSIEKIHWYSGCSNRPSPVAWQVSSFVNTIYELRGTQDKYLVIK